MALVPVATDVVNGTVLMLITLVVLPIAAIAFAGSGGAWRKIGSSGPFAIDTDRPQPGSPEPASPGGRAAEKAKALEELRAEVRDLVVATNERRLRRRESPMDVEAETDRQVADFIGLGE